MQSSLGEMLLRVKRYGLAGTTMRAGRAIFGLLGRALYLRREGYFTCADLESLVRPGMEVNPEIRIFEAGTDDLQRLDGVLSRTLRRRFRRRMETGRLLFLAEIDGALAGYCWLAFEATYANETDCIIPVANGEAYGYGAFTLPQYRGRGVYRTMLIETIRAAERRGISRIRGVVDRRNAPARAALRRAGIHAESAAGSVRMLGFKRRWRRPLREGERL